MASLRSEAAGLVSILPKEVRYNAHVQLMIFTDCPHGVLLMIMSKWGQSNFWPGPGLLLVLTCRCDAASLLVSPLDSLRNMRGVTGKYSMR